MSGLPAFALFDVEDVPFPRGTRSYRDVLTADVNEKGVLDIDTVKGCTAGMSARPGTGCYGGCYAAKIAAFRGIDFAHSVERHVKSATQARIIERAVKAAPQGFFRIGTMGDPSHAWEHTVRTVEWLAPFATPVIVTKHWRTATVGHLERLATCGTVLNTSVSALDTPQELRHRESQIERYRALGGVSIARIVSCEFNTDHEEGRRMAAVQDRLFTLRPTLDNPLRVPRTHDLVQRGVIRVDAVKDLSTIRTMSLAHKDTYVGHCSACPDQCGLSSRGQNHPKPSHRQLPLFENTR